MCVSVPCSINVNTTFKEREDEKRREEKRKKGEVRGAEERRGECSLFGPGLTLHGLSNM